MPDKSSAFGKHCDGSSKLEAVQRNDECYCVLYLGAENPKSVVRMHGDLQTAEIQYLTSGPMSSQRHHSGCANVSCPYPQPSCCHALGPLLRRKQLDSPTLICLAWEAGGGPRMRRATALPGLGSSWAGRSRGGYEDLHTCIGMTKITNFLIFPY